MVRRSQGRDLGLLPDAQSCPSDRGSAIGRWTETGDRRGPRAYRPTTGRRGVSGDARTRPWSDPETAETRPQSKAAELSVVSPEPGSARTNLRTEAAGDPLAWLEKLRDWGLDRIPSERDHRSTRVFARRASSL